MPNKLNIEKLLQESGAFLQGHFLLTSGMHSPHYYEKFRLLENPVYNQKVAEAIADRFRDKGIEVVASAAVGGILLAYEVARSLGVRCIFAERVHTELRFRRGFQVAENEKVLLVEDIVTTGGSVMELRELVAHYDGDVRGVGIIVDRSVGKFNPEVEWSALYTAEVENYKADECPLCKNNVPLTTRGRSGKK